MGRRQLIWKMLCIANVAISPKTLPNTPLPQTSRSYSLSTLNHAELQKLSNWPLPTVHCWQSTMHCPTEQNGERFSCFQETSGRKVTRGINDFNEQLSSNLLRFLYCLNRGSTLLEINNGDGEPWGLMLVSGTLFTVCANCGFQRANREGEQGVRSAWRDCYRMLHSAWCKKWTFCCCVHISAFKQCF